MIPVFALISQGPHIWAKCPLHGTNCLVYCLVDIESEAKNHWKLGPVNGSYPQFFVISVELLLLEEKMGSHLNSERLSTLLVWKSHFCYKAASKHPEFGGFLCKWLTKLLPPQVPVQRRWRGSGAARDATAGDTSHFPRPYPHLLLGWEKAGTRPDPTPPSTPRLPRPVTFVRKRPPVPGRSPKEWGNRSGRRGREHDASARVTQGGRGASLGSPGLTGLRRTWWHGWGPVGPGPSSPKTASSGGQMTWVRCWPPRPCLAGPEQSLCTAAPARVASLPGNWPVRFKGTRAPRGRHNPLEHWACPVGGRCGGFCLHESRARRAREKSQGGKERETARQPHPWWPYYGGYGWLTKPPGHCDCGGGGSGTRIIPRPAV